MRLRSKTSTILSATAVIALLAGCSAPAPEAENPLVSVVASTNVYGAIATQLGGEHVEVTSIIDDPSQDPHSFEADARVQLALSKADLIIENGGGYDFYVAAMLSGADNDDVTLLNASRLSGQDMNAEDFNEHVWFSTLAMKRVAEEVVDSLSRLDPPNTADFEANGEAFTAAMDALITRQAELKTEFDGTRVAITEPLPGYLLDSLGLVNMTPPEFSEAVEEGSDVPAAVLGDSLSLFDDGKIAMLFYNEQTSGAATERMVSAAKKAEVPVVPVFELMPADVDYATWMTGILDSLETALRS